MAVGKRLVGAQFTPFVPLLRPHQIESKFALLYLKKIEK